jgi:hypothetical protein
VFVGARRHYQWCTLLFWDIVVRWVTLQEQWFFFGLESHSLLGIPISLL